MTSVSAIIQCSATNTFRVGLINAVRCDVAGSATVSAGILPWGYKLTFKYGVNDIVKVTYRKNVVRGTSPNGSMTLSVTNRFTTYSLDKRVVRLNYYRGHNFYTLDDGEVVEEGKLQAVTSHPINVYIRHPVRTILYDAKKARNGVLSKIVLKDYIYNPPTAIYVDNYNKMWNESDICNAVEANILIGG